MWVLQMLAIITAWLAARLVLVYSTLETKYVRTVRLKSGKVVIMSFLRRNDGSQTTIKVRGMPSIVIVPHRDGYMAKVDYSSTYKVTVYDHDERKCYREAVQAAGY